MEAMRETWTDERLDDLTDRMEKDFRRVDARFDHVDQHFDKIDARFERVDERFERVDDRFDQLDARMDARFDSLQQTIIAVGGGLIGTLILASAGSSLRSFRRRKPGARLA